MKKKFFVTHRINARFVAEVEAENIEEAKELATMEYWNADFGPAEDIDGKIIKIEDEDGNFVYED